MSEFFVFGSAAFFLLVLIEIIALGLFVGQGKGIGVLVSLAVFVFVLVFFAGVNVFGLLTKNPIYSAALILGYAGVGAVWLFPYWRLHIDHLKERADDYKYAFLKQMADWDKIKEEDVPTSVRNIKMPASLKEDWEKHKLEDSRIRRAFTKPIVRENKDRLVANAAGWPISMLLTAFDRGLRRVALQVYYWVGDKLQAMTDNAWKNVESFDETT